MRVKYAESHIRPETPDGIEVDLVARAGDPRARLVPCPPQVAGSQEGFQVRAHDFFYPANTSTVKEFVHVERFPSPIGLENLEGDIEPELVAMLEAVGDGFFRAVDAEGDSTHLADLHPFGKSIAREPEEADRRIRETGRFRTLLDRHVNLMGHLRRQFVECQRRDEADHAVRDLESDRDEIGIREGRQFGKAIKTAADLLEDARIPHGVESPRVYAKTERLRGAQRSAVDSKESAGIPDRFFYPVSHETTWIIITVIYNNYR